jgi:repressor LexA
MLALASAVSRLADAHASLAIAVGDLTPPRRTPGHGDLLMVQVFCTSMIDAAIAPGDLAVIRKQPGAENGEIVAARLPGHAATDATIKEFKRDQNGHAWLIPRNPADQQPIPADDAESSARSSP